MLTFLSLCLIKINLCAAAACVRTSVFVKRKLVCFHFKFTFHYRIACGSVSFISPFLR